MLERKSADRLGQEKGMSRATAAPSLAEPMDYERPAAWKVIAVLILAEICGTSALAMPIPALSAFLHTYGSAIAAGWIMSSFLLVSASVAALCGSLGDRFGRKPVMMAVLAVVFVGSVMSAPTESFGWVVAGRCLQGAAGEPFRCRLAWFAKSCRRIAYRSGSGSFSPVPPPLRLSAFPFPAT